MVQRKRIGTGEPGLTFGHFQLTPTGLVVSGKPSFDEWQLCGDRLKVIEGAVQFWIGDWLNFGEPAYGEKYSQAIDQTQADTWRHYAWVSEKVGLCIRIHNLSWSHHLQVAKFSDRPELQRQLLEKAEAEQLSVTDFKALIRSTLHDQKIREIASGQLTQSEYDVVCADPPWAYENSGFDQSAAAHYPTMDVQAICDLPEKDETFPRFADESVAFIWATSPLLPAAVTVLTAWGFEYKACIVWVKDRAPGL